MKNTQNFARELFDSHGTGPKPNAASTLLTTPVFIGEKMYFHTMPMMASDGTEKKKNTERTKSRPTNLRLWMTASGMAITVTPTITTIAYRIVKPRPCRVDGSVNTFL